MEAGTQTKDIFLLCSISIRYYYYKTRNKTSLYFGLRTIGPCTAEMLFFFTVIMTGPKFQPGKLTVTLEILLLAFLGAHF